MMSKDKYPSIFLKPNGDYCVYYPSNVFLQRAFGKYYRIFSNIQSRDAFRPIGS